MSDLLAKCDWNNDELRVELSQWPEVVTVWVNGKAMPYAPVVADVRSLQAENAKLQAEIAELEGTIECLKGLAEANYERCDTCEAMLDCDECLRADASHKELRGLQAENKRLREQIERLQPKDCEGNALDIADTVNMLRSEYDGDHEWDDVVVELALTKWGGDRWIVRGSKGEAWACDCAKTGYDEDAYEGSDDVEPIDNPTLVEAENAKLRERVSELEELTDGELYIPQEWYQLATTENDKLRELVEDMLSCIEIRAAFNRPPTTDMYEQFAKRASELGVEVDE